MLVPKTDTRLASAFGHVDGLDGIRARRHVEVLPYVTTSIERKGTAQPGDPFERPSRLFGGTGLDIKWGMTSSFTLDGAINPDFGQVEVDPAVVNLKTRECSLFLVGRWLWNAAGDVQMRGYSLQAGATTRSYWAVSAIFDFDLPHLSDRETRGGPVMRRPGGYGGVVFLSSDDRKRAQLSTATFYAWNTAGGWSLDASPSLVFRPSPSLSVSVGPSLGRSRVVTQYVTAVTDPTAVATYGRRIVFSDLDRTEVSVVSRLNVIFTPKASFEVYAQPLVSSGRYWGLKEFVRPRTFEFRRYGVDAGTLAYDDASLTYTIDPDGAGPAALFRVGEPNFTYTSLRVNAVFRWEWRLGSALYAVWTQQREDSAATGDFRLGRDLRSMVRAPGDHVFTVKLACWFSR